MTRVTYNRRGRPQWCDVLEAEVRILAHLCQRTSQGLDTYGLSTGVVTWLRQYDREIELQEGKRIVTLENNLGTFNALTHLLDSAGNMYIHTYSPTGALSVD